MTLAAFFMAASAVCAETEYHDFADEYVEFLGIYADAGSEAEVDGLREQVGAMQSEDLWLRQAAETLLSAVTALERDPQGSAAAVVQSVLYVTKGLSDADASGKGFTHRLTKEERVALLARLRVLRDTKWIRTNETVMIVSGILADFLKSDKI